MKYKRKRFVISWILVILWMIIILSFSTDTAEVSRGKSSAIVEKIEPYAKKIIELISSKPYDRDILVVLVRKCAHIFNYFVLYLLSFNTFRHNFGIKRKAILFAIFLSLTFACLDEYYQTFIPGRGGKISDVFIDSIGFVIGMFIINIRK